MNFSTYAEIVAENTKLKDELEELEEETENHLASLNFYKEQCEELKQERKQLKEELKELKEEDSDEEGLTTIMFEGKEYYLDTSDGDNDVYDTAHEIVGSWDGEQIIFS